jgi:hypothetical protein
MSGMSLPQRSTALSFGLAVCTSRWTSPIANSAVAPETYLKFRFVSLNTKCEPATQHKSRLKRTNPRLRKAASLSRYWYIRFAVLPRIPDVRMAAMSYVEAISPDWPRADHS